MIYNSIFILRRHSIFIKFVFKGSYLLKFIVVFCGRGGASFRLVLVHCLC
jgi:hypothetical protein